MIRGHEQWVYHGIKFGNYKNDWSLLKIREIFQDPDSPSSFGSAHVSHQACIPSSSKKAWPRFKNAAKYTRGYEYSRKRFWLSTCPTCLEEFHNDSRNFGNTIGDSEKRRNWEKWEWRTIAINTFTLLFRWKRGKKVQMTEIVLSLWPTMPRVLGLVLESGMTFPSYFSSGDASGKIPWPYGISELGCEFPSGSLREGEESHARFAVDQGNRSSQIAGWSHHSEISDGLRFPWLWRHWKGATISKHTFERRSVSRSRELRRTTDFSEEDKLIVWSMNIFDLLDPTMKFKDFRDCSVSNWRTMTFRILIYVGSKHCYWQVILHRTKFLEGLYVSKLQDSSQAQTIMALYNREILRGGGKRDYHRLRMCVWNCTLNKLKEVKISGFRARLQSVWP